MVGSFRQRFVGYWGKMSQVMLLRGSLGHYQKWARRGCVGEVLECIPSYSWNTDPSFFLPIWVAGNCWCLCVILEEGPSLPISSAACELLSVSVQVMFCTAVGDSVWDKLPPQFHLLIFFKNYPCADLPTRLWTGRALASKENENNPSGKWSSTQYEVMERSSWEFGSPCHQPFYFSAERKY